MPKSKPTLGPVEHTARGFEIVHFSDRYAHPCSLQQSSLADFEEPGASAIWLGVTDAAPTIMASDARRLGMAVPDDAVGWVPYPIPREVLLTTRMHLDRAKVEALISHLQKWLKANTFGPSSHG